MLCRPSERTDIPGMARIRALERGSLEYWENRIAGYLDGTINPRCALAPRACYVAVDQSAVVGFVAGHLTRRHDCDGELQWINVSPERRRAGIASELVQRLARWFVEQQAFRVCVNVDPSNEAARAFYTEHGTEKLNDHWMVWNDIRKITASERTVEDESADG